jgi:hypothetical protein
MCTSRVGSRTADVSSTFELLDREQEEACKVRRNAGPARVQSRGSDRASLRIASPGGTQVADAANRRRVCFHERLIIGAATVAGALVLILVGRDLAMEPESGAEL